jgi:hypothetical protein
LKTENLGTKSDLKSLIVEALLRSQADGRSLSQSAKLRKIDLDQDGSVVILNKISDPSSWVGPVFAGQLIQLELGTLLPAVTQSLDDDTDEFLLENLQLGEQTQILKGAMYFAIVGNHVALIEGQSVKSRTLERYLTRILQDAARLEAGTPVILTAKFASGDGKALEAPTEVTVRAAPVKASSQDGAQGIHEIVEREAARAKEAGHTVFDVLATLGWDRTAIERLKKDIPSGGWIEGFFKVVIKANRAKRPISRATIEEALRNIDPADLGLRGEGSEKNGIVKLSTPRSVKTKGQLLDPTDAMLQIVEALKEWASSGKIDCKFG